MRTQITSHEEQIVEYTDRIVAMEEELKKVKRLATCLPCVVISPDFIVAGCCSSDMLGAV